MAIVQKQITTHQLKHCRIIRTSTTEQCVPISTHDRGLGTGCKVATPKPIVMHVHAPRVLVMHAADGPSDHGRAELDAL